MQCTALSRIDFVYIDKENQLFCNLSTALINFTNLTVLVYEFSLIQLTTWEAPYDFETLSMQEIVIYIPKVFCDCIYTLTFDGFLILSIILPRNLHLVGILQLYLFFY